MSDLRGNTLMSITVFTFLKIFRCNLAQSNKAWKPIHYQMFCANRVERKIKDTE